MDSNVRTAHMINVIMVESVIGKGTDNDPVRALMEYFDREGELLAQRDSWAEATKAQPVDATDVIRLLQDSWTLTNYINTLLAKDEIEASEDENAFDIALRVLKAQREKLAKFDRVTRAIEETKKFHLNDQWIGHDVGICDNCKRKLHLDKWNLCFSCWTRMQEYRAFADLVTP